jgi:hypothetical protein
VAPSEKSKQIFDKKMEEAFGSSKVLPIKYQQRNILGDSW